MSRFLKKFNTSRIATQWKRLNENRHFKYGAPFMLLVVGSPFVLKPLMSVRYEYRNQKLFTPEQQEEFNARHKNIKLRDPSEITLEKIYEQKVENTPDDYENIRGPRPWEDNTDYNNQIKELEGKPRNQRKMIKPPNYDKKPSYGLKTY